ncbi:MAG: hypothetical protein H0T40_03690 [Geodermatophilaceae bacterium]|nr:hypothetical protein [Geodermatophilaceae bacterium]
MREFDTSRRSAGPERLRQQIFRGSDAVAEGLIGASRLRREYTRVLHDIYVPAGSKIDHGVRTLAAMLRMSEAAVLTAHSAAWWYGVASAEPNRSGHADSAPQAFAHSDPLQQAVDQRRPAALARLGWKVLHMTSSDLHDPHRTLMELRGLLAA